MKWFRHVEELYYGCLAMGFSGLLIIWFLASLVDWEKVRQEWEETHNPTL